MLLILAWSIVYGSETTTNLTMWKFCRMELNYTEEICSNLSNGEGFWIILTQILAMFTEQETNS